MPKLVLPAWVRSRQEEGCGPGQGQVAQGSICTDGSRTGEPGLLGSQPRSLHSISMESMGWGMRRELLQDQKEGQQLEAPRLSPMWLHIPAGSRVTAWHRCGSAEHSCSSFILAKP